jgi:hypothetical protein
MRHNALTQRRTALLTCSAACLAIALAIGFPLLTLARSPAGLFALMLTIGGGLLAARGIREFADVFLREPCRPWYIRRGAIPFGIIMLVLTNALFAAVGTGLVHVLGPRAIFWGLSQFLVCLASEFFCIAITDLTCSVTQLESRRPGQPQDAGRPLHRPYEANQPRQVMPSWPPVPRVRRDAEDNRIDRTRPPQGEDR